MSASQYAPVTTTGAIVPVTGTAAAGAATAGAPHGRDVLVTPDVDRQIEGALSAAGDDKRLAIALAAAAHCPAGG
jgi:hypothetical protein